MKTSTVLSLVVAGGAMASAASADIITQWNFNTPPPGDANVATGTLVPSIGSGAASPLGGISTSFASGDANGGSTDPQVGDDSGWQTTSYPAQGTGSGTAGVRFDVSTAGFFSVSVTFDIRHSNTSSRFVRFEYSADGVTFTPGPVFEATSGGDTWYNLRTIDLSFDPAVENNPDFAFRIVTVFDPGNPGSYAAATAASAYAGSGTLRYDMVTVNGVVPAPGSAALLAAAGLLAIRRRR